jgi:two-component system, chemotaxis family, sensor kinase CheA
VTVVGDMDAYKDIFLQESAEYLQAIIDGLLALEERPHDLGPVEVVFRGAHSLKGMSATMGYGVTADLTHKMESLMDTVRKREQPPDHSLIDLMLEAVDAVKGLIEAESNGAEPPDVSGLSERIVARAARAAGAPASEPPAQAEGDAGTAGAQTAEEAAAPAVGASPVRGVAAVTSSAEQAGPAVAGECVHRIRVTLEDECVLRSVRAYMVIKRLSQLGSVIDTIPSAREIEDEQFGDSFDVVVRTAAPAGEVAQAVRAVSEVREAIVLSSTAPAPAQKAARSDEGASGSNRRVAKSPEGQTVRIAITHLDSMVDLVGELVILRSRIEAIARDSEMQAMIDAVEQLHSVSSELQHEVMQTRMVPVGNIFNRFPRMVRDLARDLGKEVGFMMDGLDIELDRTVLDEIGDPIVHLLRNAIDHGLESPEEREAAGKSAKGIVRLSATRERDSVEIVVADDGRGMDVERIWAKACQRGMAEPSQREFYSEEQILQFTCTPGFSTAETATKVSGRGVGMDVVRGKIELLGGSLYIHSSPGMGSAFVLTLPLTLAIIQALLLGMGDRVYALPLGSVTEVLSPDEAPIETVDGKPVVVLRDGAVVPVYRLAVVLGMAPPEALMPEPEEHIVLVQMGVKTRALAVRRLIGRQEIVVKPLGAMFSQVRGLGGATVLGDGRVALILDPRSLFQMGEQGS